MQAKAPVTPETGSNPPIEVSVTDQFTLSILSTVEGCELCRGLPTVEIRCDAGVVGTLVGEYPWFFDITSGPESHPQEPHYQIEWVGVDNDGNSYPGLANTLYFSAVEMMKKAQHGVISVKPEEKRRKKG